MTTETSTSTTPSAPEVVETKQKKNAFARIDKRKLRIVLGIIIVVAIGLSGYYWYSVSQKIYTDKAEIYAPLITLGTDKSGVLQKILVHNGDSVTTYQPVAKLENGDFVRAQTDGVVVATADQIGKLFAPGTPIVTMIAPNDLRVIAHVAENKGLTAIKVGQKVVFEVDAFGSQKFYGEVEEIAQTSDQSSVVFSISDKRDQKDYSIKIKYANYPQLLNGMSAKAWILK